MWHLASTADRVAARLTFPLLSALTEVSRPEEGTGDWVWNGQTLPGLRLLQLTAPWPASTERLDESYVRGTDLVARFRENSERARCDVYWTALPPQRPVDAGGLELRLATQTQLLDGRPQAAVTAHFPEGTERVDLGEETFPGLEVFRPQGIRLSYVQAVFPSDFAGCQWTRDSQLRSTVSLQLDRLEKGVIRCCRVRGWWVAREADDDRARELAADFLAAPLPLTT